MNHRWIARGCVIVAALGAGACGGDKGESMTDASSGATEGDKTTTDVMPTTGGSGSGSIGETGSGTTGDASSGTAGDPTPGTTGEPTSASGSTGDAPGDPAIEERCHDMIDFGVKANEGVCVCSVAAGEYPDLEACLADYLLPEPYVDCLCSVYAKYPESNAFFDCVIPVNEAYASCVASAACDQAMLDACVAAGEMASGACGSPPQAVLDDPGAVKCADEL